MTNLARFDHDGIELLINTETGESFATVSGYARMVGKNQTTISKRLKGMNKTPEKQVQTQTRGGVQGYEFLSGKEVQVETTQGLQTVTLIGEDLICEWLPKDNHDMASKVLRLGVRMFLHTIAGFQVKSDAITELEANVMFFKGWNAELRADNSRLTAENSKLTDEISKQGLEIVDMTDEYLELKERIAELERENSKLGEQLELMEDY